MRRKASTGSWSSSTASAMLSSCDDLHQLAKGSSGIVGPEDRAPRDEEIRAGGVCLPDRLPLDATVYLDANVGRKKRAQLRDSLECLGHERLARVAGVNRHAEHEVGALGSTHCMLDWRLRIERHSDTEPESARMRDRPSWLIAGFDVEGDAVATRLRYGLEVTFWLTHHEVAVQSSSPSAHQGRDRGEDDRADGDLGDEVAVAGVEVEDPRAHVDQQAELLAEPREVRRIDRRLDLDSVCPLRPAHLS